MQVVEFYSFEDIAEVATIKSSSLQIVMRTGGRVVLTTTKAASVRDLINQFIIEASQNKLLPAIDVGLYSDFNSHLSFLIFKNIFRRSIKKYFPQARSGEFEYARVLADFSSGEENALQLRAGELVAVVARDDEYTRRGWLYGIRDGQYGLFPADYVAQLSPRSIR